MPRCATSGAAPPHHGCWCTECEAARVRIDRGRLSRQYCAQPGCNRSVLAPGVLSLAGGVPRRYCTAHKCRLCEQARDGDASLCARHVEGSRVPRAELPAYVEVVVQRSPVEQDERNRRIAELLEAYPGQPEPPERTVWRQFGSDAFGRRLIHLVQSGALSLAQAETMYRELGPVRIPSTPVPRYSEADRSAAEMLNQIRLLEAEAETLRQQARPADQPSPRPEPKPGKRRIRVE